MKQVFTTKKAQFFSLIVFLIFLILIIIFALRSSSVSNEQDFNLVRLEKTLMSNFVTDFDQIYLEQILETSLKPAVAGVLNKSQVISKDGLVIVMNGLAVGYIDEAISLPATLERVLGTVTFALDGPPTLNITLERIEQNKSDTLTFTFNVDYRFDMHGTSWEKNDSEIIIDMDIYSLKHPSYDYQYIERDWIPDPSTTSCFSNEVFTDAEECLEHHNLRPLLDIDLT